MEANKILNADILDIIFEGKNKAYGAYQLRKTYNGRMIKALIATGIVLLLLVGGLVISNIVGKGKKETFEVVDASLAEVKKDEPPPPVIPPPVVPPPPPEIKQIQFTPPVIKKDEEVKKDEVIQEIEEDAAISTQTVVTDNVKQVVQAPVEVKESQVAAVPTKAVEEDQIFQKVEIEAEYPGGQAAWAKYLKNNLNGNTPSDNSAPVGSYTVIVRFVVAKDGTISDVVAETSHGYGMEQEALKVIKKGPKWKPAEQNGNIVKAYRRQPITFLVMDQE